MKKIILSLALGFILFSCSKDDNTPETKTKNKKYQTENVVLLVIDGPRISETWLEKDQILIPNRLNLLKQGVFISNFKNNGLTNTNAGHTALITGVYDSIQNNGKELPTNPSVLQQWLKQSKNDNSKAWVIVSKDKLEVLNNTKNTEWNNKYMPKADAGTAGNPSAYREDAVTISKFKNVIKTDKPNIVVINLKDVDSKGHSGDWDGYLDAIETTDQSIKEIWEYLQGDENYKGKTTLIVSNDHGRHVDDNGKGFISHGDDCTGCRHIEFFAIGPDFKQNTTISTGSYEQIDVANTIAELLDVKLEYSQGKVIKDIFK
ncbi:sulfatase-like hydrolase/transferase [Myroides pelagicus]|uniref:Sulfatase-like hydrolase/transferase n=1 Tax=Myroides pelagicus TaxID=270914 RepID=A0A7K1GJS5_9FLAO|nr:alkaline phosphatase family protein [Myroides pelagicus]MEC4113773.1 alkaline phosphatase family protein [Myroides pelagicus]MTH28769.1 sulfatase-like hydrolase/transferase [Myroides pelagicus]